MQQLNNIDFSVLIKDETLEIHTNYLMNVYQSYIVQSTLENATNRMDLLVSSIGVFVNYGNYFANVACSSTSHIEYI